MEKKASSGVTMVLAAHPSLFASLSPVSVALQAIHSFTGSNGLDSLWLIETGRADGSGGYAKKVVAGGLGRLGLGITGC